MTKLSLIIPVYNGAATVPRLVAAIQQELRSLPDWEIVLINDGSPSDNSAEVCAGLALKNPNIKFLDLSRNFGEHNAVMAGLGACAGEAAVILDDDFQNPVSEVKISKKGDKYY